MLNSLKPNSKLGQFLAVSGLSSLITPVRVKSIILNDSHPRFTELGEWNALGIIEYDSVTKPSDSKQTFPIATPLLPNLKNYPLVNELVYVLSLPSSEIGTATTATETYYVSIIGLWNHPHHNGYPQNPGNLDENSSRDYQQTSGGDVRRVTDSSTDIFLGNTFKEKPNIHPLLPFEGDMIYEGRWGNSIRFGSTVKDNPNNWSSTGNNGDSITVIRNGQGKQSEEGWIPITENINNDESSVYLTSTQQVPLNGSSVSYNSYKSSIPLAPNKFSGKQILLNSGRLVFNSTTDHILLSSAKSINLNSLESVNIDTKDAIIQTTGKIYLADKNASQQALLGNKTTDFLKDLLTSLNKVSVALSALAEILPPTPQVAVNTSAAELTATISRLLPQITTLLSRDVYIKDNGMSLSVGSSQTLSPSEEAQIRNQDTPPSTTQPATNQPVSQSQTEPEQDLPPASPDTRT
jgi:hypothetical protein